MTLNEYRAFKPATPLSSASIAAIRVAIRRQFLKRGLWSTEMPWEQIKSAMAHERMMRFTFGRDWREWCARRALWFWAD